MNDSSLVDGQGLAHTWLAYQEEGKAPQYFSFASDGEWKPYGFQGIVSTKPEFCTRPASRTHTTETVSPGMAVRAEIKTDRQRVIDYFLSLLKGYIMKVCGKDKVLWREVKRAVLAGLLCLPFYSAVAESITPVTEGKMETVNPVPEGYRPLPVTEFVVEAERDDTYQITVAVEYPGETSHVYEWLENNFTGKIEIYRIQDNKLISTYFVFEKKNDDLSAGFHGLYLDRVFWGETYEVKLNKGKHVISPQLFFKEGISGYAPNALVSFNRVKPTWW